MKQYICLKKVLEIWSAHFVVWFPRNNSSALEIKHQQPAFDYSDDITSTSPILYFISCNHRQ